MDLFNSNPGRNSVINFRLPRHLSSSTPAVSPSASPSVSFRQISVIRSVSDCQDSVFDEDLPLQSQLPNTLTEMDDKEAEIQFMKDELETKRLCLPIRDVFMHNIEDTIEAARDMKNDLKNRQMQVLALKRDFKDQKTAEQWQKFSEDENLFTELFLGYINALNIRINHVQNESQEKEVSANAAAQSQQLQEALSAQNEANNERNVQRAKTKAIGKCKQVNDDIKKLDRKLRSANSDDWTTVDDHEVENGMKNVKIWAATISKITELYRDAEDILHSEGINANDINDVLRTSQSLKNLEILFTQIKDAI